MFFVPYARPQFSADLHEIFDMQHRISYRWSRGLASAARARRIALSEPELADATDRVP